MKVIYVKSREVYGIVREGSPLSDYIHYRALCYGLGCKICSKNDIIDLTDYINNPNNWQEHEMSMISMVIPELSQEDMLVAARFAKVAG